MFKELSIMVFNYMPPPLHLLLLTQTLIGRAALLLTVLLLFIVFSWVIIYYPGPLNVNIIFLALVFKLNKGVCC